MVLSASLRLRYLAVATAALTLAACGGGSSSDGSPAPPPPPAPPPAPAVPTVAAHCDQLTNGTYRLIEPAEDIPTRKVAIKMDAEGVPQVTFAEGVTDTLKAGSEACVFTDGGGGTLVVGKGGIAMGNGDQHPGLLFPEQAADTADLTGTWNRIAWQRAGDGGTGQPFELEYGTVSFAAGTVTGVRICDTIASRTMGCTSHTPTASLALDPAGGFIGAGRLAGARGFVFKDGSDTLQVWLDPDGSLSLLSKQSAWNWPTVGAVSTSWNTQVNSAGALVSAPTDNWPGISTSINTVTGIDMAAGTFTRDASNGGAAAVPQTLFNNAPQPGMRVRAGVAGSVSPAVMVRLTSSLTAVGRLNVTPATTPGTGNGFLALSIGKP